MREDARRLPHRHVLGQPLFATFRLAGTLPANRVFPAVELTSGKAFVAMDRLLDRARNGPLFLRRQKIAAMVVQCLRYGQDRFRRYELHAFVVMPNHAHLLVTPHTEDWLGPLKGFTARRANQIMGRSGTFWQDESYDHLVRNPDEFEKIRRYIELNPVAAGLAHSPEEFPWSSACGAGFQPADPLPSGSSRPEGRLC